MADAAPARAQAESREGIYLQNQILQLRQELDQVRRGGGGAPSRRCRAAAMPRRSGELVGALLDRVATLEDETRRLRGRLEQAEFQSRNQAQQLEKLQGEIDYRLQQLEGTGGGSRPAPPPRAPGRPTGPVAAAGRRAAAAAPAAAAARRRSGRCPRARRRSAGATSPPPRPRRGRCWRCAAPPRALDARFLLADARAGKRNWQDAAVAYDEAYKPKPRPGSRAPEALLGFGTSLANLNQKREACDAFALAAERVPAAARGDEGEAGRRPARAGCR